MRKTETLLSNS